jgi:hypothetical protein
MQGHPLIEWNKLLAAVRSVWAKSLGVVLAFILGVLSGIVYSKGDIIDDCRYTGSFRVHSQAFNCQRKI